MMENHKILVVDDEKNICELIRLYLKKEGFDVICAHSGTEALMHFRDNKFAAVILDIMMPGIDGIDVLKEIRKNNRLAIGIDILHMRKRINILKLKTYIKYHYQRNINIQQMQSIVIV